MSNCAKKCKNTMSYYINPSDLKHWIDIVSLEGGAADGIGGTEDNESSFYSTMAAIWPATSKELVENMKNELRVTHKIRFYYYPGITPDMEVVFGTRQFEIVGIINPNEANQVLDLLCYERI